MEFLILRSQQSGRVEGHARRRSRQGEAMKTSTDRILTTHVGSLPRPVDLLELLAAKENGAAYDRAALDARVTQAVGDIVRQQIAAGIDSVSDGEQSKISYTFYVRHRLAGIGTASGAGGGAPPQTGQHRDITDHPDFAERLRASRTGSQWFNAPVVPCCVGPVSYADRAPLEADLKNLSAAVSAQHPGEAFMNAASPGVLTKFVP